MTEMEQMTERIRQLAEVPWPVHKVIPVGWLIAAGLCSGPCLTAYGDQCDCTCSGRYHGRLQELEIELTNDDVSDWPKGRRDYASRAIRESSCAGL